LVKLDDKVDINKTWDYIKGNIKTAGKECLGCYELK